MSESTLVRAARAALAAGDRQCDGVAGSGAGAGRLFLVEEKEMAMATAAGLYRPRRPERTVLYRVLAQEAIYNYLDCGIFVHEAVGVVHTIAANLEPSLASQA